MKLSQVLVHVVLSKDRNLAGKMEPYIGRMEIKIKQSYSLCFLRTFHEENCSQSCTWVLFQKKLVS